MVLSILAALLAGATPAERIAVMDVTPRGDVSPRVAQVITDQVLSEVRRRNPDVSVIGAEEVRALLGAQAERQRLGCQGKDDLACMAEIGGALGAQRLVLGSVGQLGDTYLLTVKLVDVRHAKVLGEASARVQTKKQGELIEVAARLVGHLFPTTSLTEAPPPIAVETSAATESHPRPWAIVLGSVAVAAAVVAVVGVVQVAKFNGDYPSQISAGQPGVDYKAYQSAQSSANTWQALAIGFGAGAAVCAAGTVLTW